MIKPETLGSSKSSLENWTTKDIFETAWKHFEIIAEQRLTTFNFYVVLLAGSVGASLAAIEKSENPYATPICGIFCIVSGLAFLIIELRTRRLLEIPKKVMMAFEKGEHWPEHLRLFSVDHRVQSGGLNKIVSYGFAFRSTMILHIVFGFACIFCPLITKNRSPQGQASAVPQMTSAKTP